MGNLAIGVEVRDIDGLEPWSPILGSAAPGVPDPTAQYVDVLIDCFVTAPPSPTPTPTPSPTPTPTPPPAPTAPPVTPTPGTVEVTADRVCVDGNGSIELRAAFTDNDVPLAGVTVTLAVDGVPVDRDIPNDGSDVPITIAWPDGVTSVDVLVDGAPVTTLLRDELDCEVEVLGEEVENPEPVEPAEEVEVLGEEVVAPAPVVEVPVLAATGLDSTPALALGSLLIVLGMVALLGDRRRSLHR